MNHRLASASLRLLVGGACVVVISWGIMAAAHLLSLVLLGLLLAYSLLPLPKWMISRFKLRRSAALALTVGLLGTLQLTVIFLLYDRFAVMGEKLPIYQERLRDLFGHSKVFLNSHGVDTTGYSIAKLSPFDEVFKYVHVILPHAGRFLFDGLMVLALGVVFVITMSEDTSAKEGRLAAHMAYYGEDVQRYIGIMAATGALNSIANLILLVAFGVDFPLVWCVLYFFLQFIPNIGFILALVPPTCLALLMLGWKTALLVAGGLVLVNLVSDYVISPLFMRKGVHVSFVEMFLSLLWWGFLLGPVGGVLAIPLTLSLKKFIARLSGDGGAAGAADESNRVFVRSLVE